MRLTLTLFVGLLFTAVISAQTGTLRGTITDDIGLGMPGANVVIVGTSLGTSTDVDGDFIIYNVPEGDHTLQVSYLGYKTFDEDFSMSQGGLVDLDRRGGPLLSVAPAGLPQQLPGAAA